MVEEFGLTVINAERTVAVQHAEVTALAQPILKRLPVSGPLVASVA
jgi:hypothetical protein